MIVNYYRRNCQQNILLFLSKRQFNRDIIRAENQGVELLKEEAIVEWLKLNSINLDKTIFFKIFCLNNI